MTPALPPDRLLAPLVPVSGLVRLVLGAAAHGVSEGSRCNARAALEARNDLTRHSAEVIASVQAPAFRARTAPRDALGQRTSG